MPCNVIMIAVRDPSSIYSGAESYVRAFCRAAVKAGYSPHVFCAGDRTERKDTDYGVIHKAWSPVRPFRGVMLRLHQPFLVNLAAQFAEGTIGPHLIHSFGAFSGVGAALAQRLRSRGHQATLVTTPFSTYAHETRAKLLQRNLPLLARLQLHLEVLWVRLSVEPSERGGYRNADLTVPNYDNVRALVEAEFGPGIRFGKMTYASEQAFLGDGADEASPPALLTELQPSDAPLIASVSRHDARKGLDVLLSALAQLRSRGIRFRACLVGGGELLEWHRRLADKLGLSGCTILPGLVPSAFAYLRQADIFVLPSLEEGSGSVSLLEAMQAGVAPVISAVDGLPEDVTDGESAIFVRPGDPGDLADALARCLTDPALRAKVACGARERYRTRFSADSYVADVRRLYTSLGFPPAVLQN
jgi:glycosyltransferase involved in cell wall biosynthesis